MKREWQDLVSSEKDNYDNLARKFNVKFGGGEEMTITKWRTFN
jgi:hypothetical protein